MISIKAIAAISLTGLGAAAMSADVYLASHTTTVPAEAREPTRGFHPRVPARSVPSAPSPAPAEAVVTLQPVTIYASAGVPRSVRRALKAAPEARELVPCSEWRSLESGPAGHRVQALCIPH